MKFSFALAAIFVPGAALAGGLDRSGQSIAPLFETGGYVELSYGMVTPEVSGVLAGALGSGDVGSEYSQTALAFKSDLGQSLSLALIIDQPFGAAVSYADADPGYPVDAVATFSTVATTAILRYRFSDRFSVHGGVRMLQADGSLEQGGVTTIFHSDTSNGYLVGAAYEIPDIALRVALTYNSAISMDHTTTAFDGAVDLGPTQFDFPQSVNLDVQTGIAADTLLMGSIRWVDWTATDINVGQTGTDLVDYTNDVTTYTIGIGRQFSEALAGSISVSYEESTGELASNLAPTDGKLGVSIGGSYEIGQATISAGINYTLLGDATTELVGSEFADNTAMGFGIKVGYTF